ncbi:MAG: DMT family transporter [Brevibacillus sp.]|nr:DMT family transporter [Brevibacillus sp.]
MDKPVFPPYLALLIGVVSISFSAIFVKLASAPAPVIATYRLLFSVLLTLPMLFFAKGVGKEIAGISRKVWLLSLLSGAFLAGHFLLWFESLRFTSVASSTVLVTLQPLFAFIGGFFLFGERLHPAAILGGVLAVGGSFVIGWGDFQLGGSALFGDILALLGAATVTAYWLIGQYVRKALSLTAYTLVVYSVSGICLLAYDLAFGYDLTGYPAADWGWFLLLALIPTLFGHTIFNWVIKWIPTSTVSMSILGEPIGTAILAHLILGEVVTLPQYIGGGIILLGIYLFMRFKTLAKEEQADETSAEKPA